jgi:hypothetical protein
MAQMGRQPKRILLRNRIKQKARSRPGFFHEIVTCHWFYIGSII